MAEHFELYGRDGYSHVRQSFECNCGCFRKITDPLLAVITTPGSVGVKSVAMNAGQQNTNGLEATLRVSPIHNVERGYNGPSA